MSATLGKPVLHSSVAESVYKEITTKTGRYYYFLGGTVDWNDPANPPNPVDNLQYEREVRRDIILAKEILSSDVAYVVNRIDWESGTVYDMYDDRYCTGIEGVNLISGGSGYTGSANITISGGGGSGATANLVIDSGNIVGITLYAAGAGYTTTPNVIIQDAFGTGANAVARLCRSDSGASNLQSALFYVVTDDYNIYKCLDNNLGAQSTVKPVDVSAEPFTLSDGYIWKYMGSVPAGLRNKFFTFNQMPVLNAVSEQFYSSGELRKINILNTGNSYTYARVVVTGDGYLEKDPYYISRANIISGGNGYISPSITFTAATTPDTTWSQASQYVAGTKILWDNNIYQVIKGGTTGYAPPVHTDGIAQNGSTGLKFVARRATANLTVTSNVITGVVFDGSIRSITINDGGSGYTYAPNVHINALDAYGSNATAYAVVQDNSIQRIIVTDIGKNYRNTPNVIIGEYWTEDAVYPINTQIAHGTRLYTVTTAGAANSTAPTHVTGSQQLGSAVFTYAGRTADASAILKYGSGYEVAPTITITGSNTSNANIQIQMEKSEAVVRPYIDGGRITNLVIDDGGTGYTYAVLKVIGDGSGAELFGDFSSGDLETLQSTNELLAVDGAIYAIKVVSNGYNYPGTTANVVIEGDGTGATASATVVSGRVTKVTVVSPGSGYTHANANIISAVGVGAAARVILPPIGGHGKDVVSELHTDSLAFYTTIANNTNQGFVVTNDYRQFGIIKNIQNYNSTGYYAGSIGSTCWVISGDLNSNVFVDDSIITCTTSGGEYRIISSTNTGVLVLPTNGIVPEESQVFELSSGESFIATGISAPDIDKYSGKLLYIDNRQAFLPSTDQSISLKTVFKY